MFQTDNYKWAVEEADARRQFPAVASGEQRRRYKALFDQEYPRYLRAYDFLLGAARDIERLAVRLDARRRASASPANAAQPAAELDALEKEVPVFFRWKIGQQHFYTFNGGLLENFQ